MAAAHSFPHLTQLFLHSKDSQANIYSFLPQIHMDTNPFISVVHSLGWQSEVVHPHDIWLNNENSLGLLSTSLSSSSRTRKNRSTLHQRATTRLYYRRMITRLRPRTKAKIIADMTMTETQTEATAALLVASM